MNTTAGITVGVDGSASALRAVRWAAHEAAARGVELRIVHASPHYPELGNLERLPGGAALRETDGPVPRDWPLATRQATRMVAQARQLAQTVEPSIPVTTSVIIGPRSRTLIECSGAAALLVIAARGLDGFGGLHLGSVAATVSTYARCPVVVVRRRVVPERSREAAPVVVGVDGSPGSQLAVSFAFAFAARRHLPLVAVHTWRELSGHTLRQVLTEAANRQELADDAEQLLAEQLTGWSERYPEVPVDRVVRRGRATDALLSYSPQAELVVVGARGRGGFTGMLLGSTSQALVRYASGPVAVIHPTVEPPPQPNAGTEPNVGAGHPRWDV